MALVMMASCNRTDMAPLFSSYFQPLPNILDSQVQGVESFNPTQRAMLLYDQGDYRGALKIFAEVEEDECPPGFFLYRGVCYLATDQTVLAVRELRQALDGPFSEYAQWFLALCAVKGNDIEASTQALNQIAAQPSHPFQNQAIDLLQDIQP